MPANPLDAEAIANLLKADDKQQQEKANAKVKRGVVVTEPRTYETWFRLSTHFASCTNKDCIDPRDNKVGKTMVAEVNGGEICRYCFLAGANPKPS